MVKRMARYLGGVVFAAAVLLFAAGSAQAVTYNLETGTTTVMMPDGEFVTMWGFGFVGGPITVPGPRLAVPDGESLTINLTNNLPVPVSIVIPGLGLGAAPTPVIVDGKVMSFTEQAAAHDGLTAGTASYTFAVRPGTYLYESGTDPSLQVAMGLYGAVVAASDTAGQAYSSADDPGGLSAYDTDLVFLMSEIDPDLNDMVELGLFGTEAMPSNVHFTPQYYLINGVAFSQPYVPAWSGGAAPRRLLLRYINASYSTHFPTVQGQYQTCIAQDGFMLPYPENRLAVPVHAGQTKDVIIEPAADGEYALYDRALNLSNAGQTPGGMLTFILVSDTPPPDTVGPFTFGVAAAPNPTDGALNVTLTATADDTTTGNSNIAAAEWWTGADLGEGLNTPMAAADGTFDSAVEGLTALVDVSALTDGVYTLFVRSQDSAGNWGAPSSVDLTVGVPLPADTLTPVRVIYRAGRQKLIIKVRSDGAPNATLTAVGFGDLTYRRTGNIYKGIFKPVANPGTVTVNSSLGGSVTIPVPFP